MNQERAMLTKHGAVVSLVMFKHCIEYLEVFKSIDSRADVSNNNNFTAGDELSPKRTKYRLFN